MSLFNMIMGRNPFGPYLLACLGITQETKDIYPLGRLRDVYTNDAADRIFILHRNYGEAGLVYDEAVAKHPNFIKKYPESDDTYWVYEFSVPEETKELVKEIASQSDNTPSYQRYTQLIRDLQSGKDNAMTEHARTVGKKIFAPVFEDSGSKTVEVGDGAVEIIKYESCPRCGSPAKSIKVVDGKMVEWECTNQGCK